MYLHIKLKTSNKHIKSIFINLLVNICKLKNIEIIPHKNKVTYYVEDKERVYILYNFLKSNINELIKIKYKKNKDTINMGM